MPPAPHREWSAEKSAETSFENSADIVKIAKTLRNYRGLTRKHPIGSVLKSLGQVKNIPCNFRLLAGFGEDAAVLVPKEKKKEKKVLLFAADGIMFMLVDADPYFAGYASILVNVNDIVAKGGTPVAVVDVLSSRDSRTLKKILSGMKEGSAKFGVPVVGGHVHPDSEQNAIDVAIIGVADGDSVLYSSTAECGNTLIAAVDIIGNVHPKFEYAWDSTTLKSKEEIKIMHNAIRQIGKEHLATACKDISNPGILGTLGMLLEYSGKGAEVNISMIPVPEVMSGSSTALEHWLCMYQGCGFVLASPENKSNQALGVLRRAGFAAGRIGRVTEEKKLIISDGKRKCILFDFEKEGVCFG